MPMALSFRYRVFVWARTAFAAARWSYAIFWATFSSWRRRSRLGMCGSSCTSTALRTWQMVHKEFFLKPLRFRREKKKADHAQDEVAHNRAIATDLEMVHADFTFPVLKHPLDVPAIKRHMQHHFGRGVRGRVGEEVLDLPIDHVARDDEPAFRAGLSMLARNEPRHAGFPHHRPFVRILDVEKVPGGTAALPQLVHAPRRRGRVF